MQPLYSAVMQLNHVWSIALRLSLLLLWLAHFLTVVVQSVVAVGAAWTVVVAADLNF